MAILEDIRTLLQSLSTQVDDLLAAQRITGKDIVVYKGVSEIDSNMGLFTAGEIRVGNNVEPGSGFSGVRIAYPSMLYDSDYYHIVGVDNDVLQFGLNANNGKAYAGAGVVELGADGISIYSSMTFTGFSTPKSQKLVWYKFEDTTSKILEVYGWYPQSSTDSKNSNIVGWGSLDITGATRLYLGSYAGKSITLGTSDIVMDVGVGGSLILRSESDTETDYTLFDSDGLHVNNVNNYTLLSDSNIFNSNNWTGNADASTLAGADLSGGSMLHRGTNGKWEYANASSSPASMGDIGYNTADVIGDAIATVLDQGYFTNDGYTFNTGMDLFLSTTGGSITHDAPSGAGNIIRKIGVAIGLHTGKLKDTGIHMEHV